MLKFIIGLFIGVLIFLFVNTLLDSYLYRESTNYRYNLEVKSIRNYSNSKVGLLLLSGMGALLGCIMLMLHSGHGSMPRPDSAVVRMAAALKLLGTQALISGIRATVAQALVGLGVDQMMEVMMVQHICLI